MSNQIGLYYPFAKFRDEEWLKLATLYWDRLGRIVPAGYQIHDSDIVHQLKEELAFVEDFSPEGNDLYAVNGLFLSMLEMYGDRLAESYGIELQSKWSSDATNILLAEFAFKAWRAAAYKIGDQILPGYASPGNIEFDPGLAYIWPSTASEEILNKLADLRLAVSYISPSTGETEWWGMHPKLAFIYMAMVAEQMAANRQFHPVADTVMDHLAVSGFIANSHDKGFDQAFFPSSREEGLLPAKHGLEAQMATIAIRSVLPKDIGNVPIGKIIKLRQQHRDEMAAFQTHIHDFVGQLEKLQDITDQKALDTQLKVAYEKQLQPQLEKLKKMMKSLEIDTAQGVVNVRVNLPTLATSGGLSAAALAYHNPVVPVVLAAGAIAYSIFPVIREKRKVAHDFLQSSPAAYLLYLQEDLEPVKLATWIAQQVRRILLGV